MKWWQRGFLRTILAPAFRCEGRRIPIMKLIPAALALTSPLFLPLAGAESSDPFDGWPEGAAPEVVGERVAKDFFTRKFRYQTNPAKAHHGLIYPEACVWYGALTFAREAGKEELQKDLIERFKPYLTPPESQHVNHRNHVDYRMIGAVPLEIYMIDGDESCLKLGQGFADAQWSETTDDGITAEARYWIDDMYMIPIIQMQAFRATGEKRYLDHAAKAMVAYLDKLQQPNGLFHHGPDSPYFWGRGNGWVAVGMAEVLRSMPEDHADRELILKGYRRMMTALKKHQGDDGMWRQLIDKPDSWPETSASAMFAFAFVNGVKHGWLDTAEYGPAARKVWIALVGYLDDDGRIREVCIGTDKGHSEKFYDDRPRATGDLHGQAPMLWTATALLRKPETSEP